jgi:peptidoglycan/xylan/chitin deacetylase (PgdA/CDA1 family)
VAANASIPAAAIPFDAYAGLRGPLHRLSRGLAQHVASKRIAARNARPIVSFTFDDIPDSAFFNGAPVLERHGLRGTFYIAGGLCGTSEPDRTFISAADCIALHRRGHEIGCHTFSHPIVQELGSGAFAEEATRNRAFFKSLAPEIALENFCYPYGLTSFTRKLQAQGLFDTCRSSRPGINAGTIDLGLLKATPIDHTSSVENIVEVIDETVQVNGWLVLFTHDVAPVPSWIGCSPDFLEAVIAAALDRHCDVLPVREALRRVKEG